jgi:hypothetical protein
LLSAVERVASGIVLNEVIDCYDGLEDDAMSMIVGGDIIAIKNKELKSLVLYPRGVPFFTALSGTVTANPGELTVTTSSSLLSEIRRGEAIKVASFWYRVSSVCKGPGGSGSRPTSVLLDHDLPVKTEYTHLFDATQLPLDGDAECDAVWRGHALRHGVTSDLQKLWLESAEEVRALNRDDRLLAQRLVDNNLLSTQFLHRPNMKRSSEDKNKGDRKRARRMRESQMHSGGVGVNAHLRGTRLEKVLQETREKNFREENGGSR